VYGRLGGLQSRNFTVKKKHAGNRGAGRGCCGLGCSGVMMRMLAGGCDGEDYILRRNPEGQFS
jgi:hypothetical protein